MTPVDTTAVVDLLGALAYAELTAFDRLAEDARLAPTLGGRAALARMAAAEIEHHLRLAERLTELGADPAEAMAPFVSALDTFHESTRPKTWLEGLVKAYVGDGLASDFYREIASFLADPDKALVLEVLADTGHADFAVREVRTAIAADPPRRRAARPVGTAPRRRGDDPVAGGHRRARPAGRADHGRHRGHRRRGPADRADHHARTPNGWPLSD